MEKRIGDLKINGQSSAAGGKYNAVIINGEGKIEGDLDCINFKINGKCDINGNVKAESVNVNGTNSIKGNLEAEKVKINGTADINGNLSVEKAETYGHINIEGDCNAEVFNIEGTFAIEGLLNAGELKLSLYGSSRAREIGGAKISVNRMSGLFGLKTIILPFGRNKGLNVDIIEGDDIYLENTRAKIVRGNNIELGPGCVIELVEYKENFKQDEKAEVVTHTKI
ncbi:polymer-forming cytoskeletal protein [Methanobacterium sp.]|uniref:polymer-forming cytoskeletal protein n=1 Tax=Methanobacterium sp. TaxID=2164 RepID=UPI003C76176D